MHLPRMRSRTGLVLAGAALLLGLAQPPAAAAGPVAPGPVYGWSWHETVEVYDATAGASPYLKVSEAVREWDRSDARVVLTTNRDAANIVVELREDACSSGCAYAGAIVDSVAVSTCYATVKPVVARLAAAESVIVHEIGHCLGLAHNPDPRSVMQSTSDGSIDRPGRMDIAALNGLYP